MLEPAGKPAGKPLGEPPVELSQRRQEVVEFVALRSSSTPL